MRLPIAVIVLCLFAACSGDATPPPELETTPSPSPTVRVLLAGDVMTGRGLADLLSTQSDEAFAGVRHLITAADVAAANLESPLTMRPHTSTNANALEGSPSSALVLANAGFDVMSLANNHATDAGPDGLLDTIDALAAVDIRSIGAGADLEIATAPLIVEANGLTIAFVAFDATGVSDEATTRPGVARWAESQAVATIEELRPAVDGIVVSVHGGTEYLAATDPGMASIGDVLATAGADVVWGHGAHVVQPVTQVDNERTTVVATSLGNLLFDQSGADRTTGYLLEVMVDVNGVAAYRVGVAEHPNRTIGFAGWLEPEGDAAWIDQAWWSLPERPTLATTTDTNVAEFRHGDLVTASLGDIDGDGASDIIASFRRPHRTTPFMDTHPEVQWADADGRSAHLGVYTEDLTEKWVAGSVLLPVQRVEVCDGALALAHDQLDDRAPFAAGAWVWSGFGFDTAPDLPGPGTPGCADIDGDGETDPVIVDR